MKINLKPKKTFILFLISFLSLNLYSQTGPGGVGSTYGSAGQPKNVLWLDASTLSFADGTDLTTWNDISGNGNDLTQSNLSYTPIFRNNVGSNLNGHPIAEFSKNDNRMTINPFNDMPTSGITNFVIYKTATGDGNDGLLSYNTSGQDNAFLLFNSNSLRMDVNGSNNVSGQDFSTGNWLIMANRWKSSGGDFIFNRNGNQVYSTNFQNGVSIPSGGSFALGGEQDNPGFTTDPAQDYDGEIAEVIMYNSFLNNAQRLIVENYLSEKYNLAFATPANDKYTGNNASYVHNIAGIGQEADGNHTQTSSGGLYLYEWNSSLANGEYMMLGHSNTTNNSTTTYTGGDLPAVTQASWARQWYIEKNSTDGIDAKLIFDFKEALSDGEYPDNVANYVLLFRAATTGAYSKVTVASQGTLDADQVFFNVADANLLDGYYTIGTDDQTNSPIEGVAGRTWYALASGDWDTPTFWTLDPSGSLPNNPGNEIPVSGDKVVIHTGKTITITTNNKIVADIVVDGILDIGTTTGHNFTKINGSGRIRLASDNFPLGDASHFVTKGQGEGTVVWQGGSYNLATAHTFFNMEVDLSASGNTITQLADYTLNGKLVVETGIFQINDNASSINLNLTVKGNVIIENTGQILTGTANARHQFNIYGDFTNNGTVKFTNRTLPLVSAYYDAEATNGIVDANFLSNNSNQTVLCNGITNFYRIEIDKGTDMTYELSISASSTANFKLFGYAHQAHGGVAQLTSNNNALGLLKGTVRIRNNVEIPHLNRNGNYNISEAAMLWVDGGTVSTSSPSNAIVPYGVAKITAGTFEALVPQGFTLRGAGSVQIEGGTLTANQIRTSVLGASHVGSYIQSGGTANIINPTNTNGNYYHFSMTYPGNVFNMSGGTLHIYDANGSDSNSGGIFIGSDASNINITGGTVIAEIAGTTNDFKITSTAPFYNLIMRNTAGNTADHVLDAGTNINGNSDADLAAQPLVVLNDLTIEASVDEFITNNEDVTIGRNFSIEEGATYTYGTNTTTFNGTEDGELYIGHSISDNYKQHFNNFTVNKSAGKSITVTGDTEKTATYIQANHPTYQGWPVLVDIDNALNIEKGILSQGDHAIRLYGEISVKSQGECGIYQNGTTNPYALVMLKDQDYTIQSENGAIFGNMKIGATTHTITLTSDIYMKRLSFYHGNFNLQTYNLKVDYLHEELSSVNFDIADGGITGSTGVFYTDGNASDGGLSILITENATYGFPLGVTGKYTPAEIIVTGYNDDGYITINPADKILQTTNLSGGDILSYYWKVNHEDFTTNPTVQLDFTYDINDDDSGNDNTYYPGKVLDESPYTRSYENDLTKVDDDSDNGLYTITFNNTGSGFTLEKANYTAGVAARFTGTVDKYYSYYDSEGGTGNGWYNNWNDPNTWDKGSVGSGVHEVPSAGSIVFIQDRARVWGNAIPNVPAEVIFEFNSVEYGSTTDQENVPRLQFNQPGNFDIGRVSGIGMVSFDNADDPVVTADWGEFANNPSNFIMYWNANQIHTNIIQPCPSLMLEGYTQQIDQNIVINGDLILTGGTTCIPLQDISIKRNLYPGAWSNGTLRFPASGNAVTMTVDGNIDYTYIRVTSTRSIIVENAASTLEHKLIVKGDINLGTETSFEFNLWRAADRPKVVLELQGETNNSYYTSSTVVPDLYRIVMNKGTSQVDTFIFKNSITLNGPTSGSGVVKALELKNGTLILDNAAINIDLNTGDDNFLIPSTACLEVKQGQVNVSGDDTGILLDGKLLILGGTVNMDDNANNGNNYIQYSSSGNATLEITSGTLIVGSQIRRGLNSTAGILNYTQTGGTVVIGKNAAPEGNRGVFEILNAGSNFTHTAGSLTVVNQQTNPTFASLYLDPAISNLSAGTTITLGNGDTDINQEFGIYSTIHLQNLTLNSHNSPKAKMWTIPLNLDGELSIEAGTEFNANALDLNCYGDFTNAGTFTANGNTTYFKSGANQQITGNTTFWNLTNQNTATVNLVTGNTDIIIENILNLETGTLNDNANEIHVLGNLNNDAVHVYGGTGIEDGISMLGSSEQTLTGSGTFGKLTINNGNDVVLPVGNTPFIKDYLKLKAGVLNIGGNILTLGINCIVQEANPFGVNNMIGTNVSFSDYGVKKFFPSGAITFTYPVGSVSGATNKYTPVLVTLTQNTSSTGFIVAKPADEIHPSIIEDTEVPSIVDADNVLQYYWVLKSENFTDGTGTIEFFYNANDVEVTAPYTVFDYITAKLLTNGSGDWTKYGDVSKFDETNQKLIFDFNNASDADFNGDYTAGINDAIPDNVPLYQSNGTGGLMDWNTASTWRVYDGNGTWVLPATLGLPDIPNGSRVRILAGDRVQTVANFINAYSSEILGTLDVGTTFANRVGNVTGTGTLYTERGTLPGGFYEAFLAETGGTLEFGGSNNYSVLSNIPQVNNIVFSGTNKREFPNLDLIVLGNFSIDGAATLKVVNEFDRKLDIHKNIVYNSGLFDAGTGASSIVELNGTSGMQTMSGTGGFTGENSFNHFIVNNTNGIDMNIPSDIEQTLTFDAGIIYTDATNILKLTNSLENIVSGAGTGKFVDGPLSKNITSGQDFNFPVGNDNRYGNVSVIGSSVSNYWIAQYYNHNPNNDGYDPAVINLGTAPDDLSVVSDIEYWRIQSSVASTAELRLRYDGLSGMPVDTDMKIAKWFNLATDAWDDVASSSPSGGYINSNSATISFNEFATGGFFTLSTKHVPTTLTWEGDVSAVWNLPANWNNNVVPTAVDDIIIPNTGVTNEPTIDIAAYCQAIDLQSSRTLTINANKSLTATGDFTLNGTLILKSPAGEGPSASFIDNGTISGSGTMQAERYMSANKFHYVSSPIQLGGNAGSDLFTQSHSSGDFNPNFYVYDETYDLDGNPLTSPARPFNSDSLARAWTHAYTDQITNDPMEVETGYAFYTTENQLITFTGTPNTGDIDINGLTHTVNDAQAGPLPNYYDGWHLVSNPYPSAIDWDLAKVGRTNIDDGIYVWDGNQYASYAGGISSGSGNLSNEVAPMQAFFVHTTADNAGFTFQNSHRVHSSVNYLKSTNKETVRPNFIKLKMEANGFNDYAVVYFKSNATEAYDGNFDAFKLYSTSINVPHIYSLTLNDETPLSINALSQSEMDGLVVPLNIKIGQAGTYSISLEDFNFEDTRVYFIDNETNTEIYLNEQSLNNYTFSCSSGVSANRFELRFFKNNAPIVINQILDKEVLEDDNFSFTIPDNIFAENDANDEIVNYSAKLVSGYEIPSWLHFDSETLKFSGLATNDNVGNIFVKIIAFDKMGASASQDFKITVINTNDAPVVVNEIPDMETNTSELYTYSIPENIFADVDLGDILTYSAELENGNMLPNWLNFNSETKTFSGTPENAEILNIEVTVNDIAGEYVSDAFKLTVKGTSGISNLSQIDIRVYPNPTSNFITIEQDITDGKTYVEIVNISGEIILSEIMISSSKTIDVSNLSAGIYFIKLRIDKHTYRTKIIKRK